MAVARYIRDGMGPCLIKHDVAAATPVDTIVVCGTAGAQSVGVVREASSAAGTVTVDIGGVYRFPKVSGAVIDAGETVDWDNSAGEVDDNQATSASGDVADFGIAMEVKGNGTTTVDVQLQPGKAVT